MSNRRADPWSWRCSPPAWRPDHDPATVVGGAATRGHPARRLLHAAMSVQPEAERVIAEARIDRMSRDVDQAFAERDRLWDVYVASQREQDLQAMEAQDRYAARLLDQYNA